MAKVTGPLFSTKARGLLARTLLYRRGGRTYSAYPYRKPKWPNTMSQQEHHALFSLLANRWSDFSTSDAEYWADFAPTQRLTNYNAYMSYNLARLNRRVKNGLVGWWPQICPAANNLYDLSPEANNALWYGPPDHWAPSRYGFVQRYTAPNAYVLVDDLPLYEFSGDFTVAYHYLSTSSANYNTVAKWTGLGSGSQWWLGCLATQIKAGIYTKDPSMVVFSSGVPASSTSWHHVALVRQGTMGHLYVDAVDEDARACSGAIAGDNNVALAFGNRALHPASWAYDGLLHDIRLYDRALSPGEIVLLAG